MSFNIQNHQFSIGEHHNKAVIFVPFSYHSQLQKELKKCYFSLVIKK